MNLFNLSLGLNLRKFAKPKNPNPPNTVPNLSHQTGNESQTRSLRNGSKPVKSPTRKRKKISAVETNIPQPNPPMSEQDQIPQTNELNQTLPHPPAHPTPTDSSAAKEWKNLDNPFSYSGNTVSILDQIKSFS